MKNKRMQNWMLGLTVALMAFFLGACGKVAEKANEVSNDVRIKGHWLMTESNFSGPVEKALEKDSMVLVFKDGQAAFSPVSGGKGKVVYGQLDDCLKGPRPYQTDGNDIVFPAVNNCGPLRATVETLNDTTLRLQDPTKKNVVRVFNKIDEQRYFQLVEPGDRHL